MLKILVNHFYRNKVNKESLKLYSSLYKNKHGLFLFSYFLYMSILAVFTVISANKCLTSTSDTITWRLFFSFFALILLIEIFYNKDKTNIKSIFANFIYNLLVPFFMSGDGLTRRDWFKIKVSNNDLYEDLKKKSLPISSFDASEGIQEVIPEADMIWSTIIDPENPNKGLQKRALICKNGYIYDPTLHQNVPIEDYKKLFNIQGQFVITSDMMNSDLSNALKEGFSLYYEELK